MAGRQGFVQAQSCNFPSDNRLQHNFFLSIEKKVPGTYVEIISIVPGTIFKDETVTNFAAAEKKAKL